MDMIPRQFIIDITYTVMGDAFKKWAKLRIKARNEKIKENQDLELELDPEVAKAFQASHNISSKFNWINT